MKMINDMDLYFEASYAKQSQPAWMKAERMDYCEQTSASRKTLLNRLFSHKKAN